MKHFGILCPVRKLRNVDVGCAEGKKCSIVPDSGTTLIVGPENAVFDLFSELCLSCSELTRSGKLFCHALTVVRLILLILQTALVLFIKKGVIFQVQNATGVPAN